MVIQWLARLTVTGVISHHMQVRPRAVSVAYGSKQSVIDEVFSDALAMNVLLLVEHSALRATVIDASADAEAAVQVLRRLATNLVRAAGGRDTDSGEAERAAERAYAVLDRAFRDWLATLGPDSDPVAERAWWQRQVWRAVDRLGRELVTAAGPAAWVGRPGVDRAGKSVHYSSSQAEAWFRTGLARALPMVAERTQQRQEETV